MSTMQLLGWPPKKLLVITAVINGLLFCTTTVRGQELFSQGSARYITEFQFDMLTGGVVVLKGALDNYSDSLNFILDTGSGGISLDSATVARLQIPTTHSNRTIRGIAGVKTVDFANNHTLRLHGLDVDSLNFHINDYDLLTSVYGVKVDGIIGYSFLRRYMLMIDYDTKTIKVYHPGDYKYPHGGYLMRPAIAGLPMQMATVADSRSIFARFYLDTGAGLNLLLSNEFVNDSTLFKKGKRRYPTIAEGLGGKAEMDMVVMKTFKLGRFKFRNVPVYLFNDEFNVTSYPFLGGLIGNDILRRFNVVLNYPRAEIHLLPNTHYRDDFDYSYTGLGLYSINGTIAISDVIPGSPADEAGLKVGDTIVAIDNSLGSNMQAYRNVLQESGKKVKMIVLRNGLLLQKTMAIKRIRS